jgi:hypothetical protein
MIYGAYIIASMFKRQKWWKYVYETSASNSLLKIQGLTHKLITNFIISFYS